MKTLLFAPLFLDEGERFQRNIKWLDYYYPDFGERLGINHLYMFDNASGDDKLNKFKEEINKRSILATIDTTKIRLNRISEHAYGYWYRAFAHALNYAMKNNFDKIIHIDTDVYILKKELCDFLKDMEKGWVPLWAPRHNYPESTLQVICSDNFKKAYEFFTEGYLQFYPYDIAETRIPWTYVETKFCGDRFGEWRLEQTPAMHWYGQTPVDMKLEYKG